MAGKPTAQQSGGRDTSYNMQRRLRAAKIREFDFIDKFKYGYRNREDQTNLPAGVLVSGSKNVLTNVSERIACRKGYALDGASSSVVAPIASAYTFTTHMGYERNIRVYTPISLGTVDSYSESNYSFDTDIGSNVGNIYFGQSFTSSVPFTLDSCKFYLKNTTSTTGLAYAQLYNHTGTFGASSKPIGSSIATSQSFDVSTLTNSYQLVTFTFVGANRVSLVAGNHYVIVLYFNSGSPASITMGFDSTAPTAPGNRSYSGNGVNWTADSIDACFYVYGYPTLSTMEYRYVDASGNVSWIPIMTTTNSEGGAYTSPTSPNFNFTSWWDNTEQIREVLMVNGTNWMYEWSGAVTTFSGCTSNTITKQGTKTWAQEGFYQFSNAMHLSQITINGVCYSYTAASALTTTLTGVSPDPTGAGISVGVEIHQTVQSPNANYSFTDLPLAKNDLIESFDGYLFLGSFQDQRVYVSQVNNYYVWTISSKLSSGAGKIFYLDSPPVSFNALENSLTVSAGKNKWYQISRVVSPYTDTTVPASPVLFQQDIWTVNRLKTNSNAATQSQAMTSAMKNDLIFISNEPTLDRLGRVESILGTTQTTNISDPIKLDFDSYDFTGASVFYNKYFIYVAVPTAGLVLIYNIVKSYWEAPQTIPISRFYTVNGILYGHSSLTAESYQLFTGRADRVDPNNAINKFGNPIDSKVVFSYQNYASPFTLKNFDKFYIEGYISSNTHITLGIKYDIDGCATSTNYDINGSDRTFVCIGVGLGTFDDAALGKNALGKFPLGGNINVAGINTLPPKFRLIKTFPRTDFFEVQYSFETIGINSNWEVLRFGPALEYSSNIPTNITQ